MQVNHEFAFEECANQFGFVFDLWGDTDSLASLAPLINGLRLFFLKKIIFYGKSYTYSVLPQFAKLVLDVGDEDRGRKHNLTRRTGS